MVYSVVLVPSTNTKKTWSELLDFASRKEAHTSSEKESVLIYSWIGGLHKKTYDKKYFMQSGSFYLSFQKQMKNR